MHLDVDLGCDVSTRMTVRLLGVDAPENSTGLGRAATGWVRSVLPVGTQVVISTQKDKKERYGRYLAAVELPEGGDLAAALVRAGHAKPYDGGAR